MFDGIKFRIQDESLVKDLHNNDHLDFCQSASIKNADIKRYEGDYKDCLKFITFPSGLIEIKGSLHKYCNDGAHNHNDFNIGMLSETLQRLENMFGIRPETASICNLEFGVNIVTPFDPDLLINSLHSFKWRPFDTFNTIGPGYGKRCKGSDQYYAKIYNKGLQYNLPDNLLRVEKRVVVMHALKYGRLKLIDLLKLDVWNHCKNELISMTDDILFNESIDMNLLTKNQQRLYITAVNQINWRGFSRDQRKRYKKAFNDIMTQYGNNHFKPIILDLISAKCDQLTNNKLHTF